MFIKSIDTLFKMNEAGGEGASGGGESNNPNPNPNPEVVTPPVVEEQVDDLAKIKSELEEYKKRDSEKDSKIKEYETKFKDFDKKSFEDQKKILLSEGNIEKLLEITDKKEREASSKLEAYEKAEKEKKETAEREIAEEKKNLFEKAIFEYFKKEVGGTLTHEKLAFAQLNKSLFLADKNSDSGFYKDGADQAIKAWREEFGASFLPKIPSTLPQNAPGTSGNKPTQQEVSIYEALKAEGKIKGKK